MHILQQGHQPKRSFLSFKKEYNPRLVKRYNFRICDLLASFKVILWQKIFGRFLKHKFTEFRFLVNIIAIE
jgi:hypothetical protein